MHPAGQLAHLQERRLGRPAAAAPPLSRSKRAIGGSPVVPCTRTSATSRIQRARCASSAAQDCEAVAGDGVALDVADAALVLALGARAVRRARPRRHAPVAAEGVEAVVERHLAGLRVVVVDQRLGVVEQQLARHAAEVPERALQALQPRRLPLVPEHARRSCGASSPAWPRTGGPWTCSPPTGTRSAAEVDLQLLAGRRLEAHRGQRLGAAARGAGAPPRARRCAG